MNNPISKTVGFCGQTVQVNCNNAEAAALVDFLCGDLPPAGGDAPPQTVCELSTADGKRNMSLYRGDIRLYTGTCTYGLAYALINEIIFQINFARYIKF